MKEYLYRTFPDDIVLVFPIKNASIKMECINPRFLKDEEEYKNILKIVENLNEKLSTYNHELEKISLKEEEQVKQQVSDDLKKPNKNIFIKMINYFKNQRQ
jgi:CHASE3 domain sensor protein